MGDLLPWGKDICFFASRGGSNVNVGGLMNTPEHPFDFFTINDKLKVPK